LHSSAHRPPLELAQLAFSALSDPAISLVAVSTGAAGSKSDMHQIGAVAERVDLSLRTVRYYEEMGLISPEQRTDGGFRLYTEENIERLLLIKQMKPLGFSLQDMRELLETRDALRSLDIDDPNRLQAADKLSQFARAADKRCTKMRGHLAAGEELIKQLSREGRRAQTASRPS
jgi:MerR family transcriptional regulator, copper efflux regulator